MNVLVIGGTGFIGVHTIVLLLHSGHSVTAFGARVPGGEFQERTSGQVTLVEGDVRDPLQVMSAVASNQFDCILHLVAFGGEGNGLVNAANAEPARAVQVNVLGLMHTLEAARMAGVRRVVWTSSTTPLGQAEQYPEPEVDETAATWPPNLYAATKFMGEHLGRTYAERYGLEVVAVRPTLVWGPGNWYRGIQQGLADMCSGAVRGEAVTVQDPGEVWDLLYVKDCGAALAHFCTAPWGGYGVVHVSGHRAGIADVAAAVTAQVPEASIMLVPGGRRIGIPFVKTERAQFWGFSPRFGLEAAVADFIATVQRDQAVEVTE